MQWVNGLYGITFGVTLVRKLKTFLLQRRLRKRTCHSRFIRFNSTSSRATTTTQMSEIIVHIIYMVK